LDIAMKVQLITYHGTLPDPSPAEHHMLADRVFRRQIELIHATGVPVIDPNLLADDARISAHSYALGLTFDDGCESDVRNAELLHEYGYSAIFCISTARLGEEGYLNTKDVPRLASLGMVIGSHSHRHIQLAHLDARRLQNELALSKQIIEDLTGSAVKFLAFPGGSYNRLVVRTALEEGYAHLLTTRWGVNYLPLRQTRLYRRTTVPQGLKEAAFQNLVLLKGELRLRLAYEAKQGLRKLVGTKCYNRLRQYYLSKA
jgi:peptidoglycan/xylan/chitin deacetylase (PgdA/CDA1 family)